MTTTGIPSTIAEPFLTNITHHYAAWIMNSTVSIVKLIYEFQFTTGVDKISETNTRKDNNWPHLENF